jgi:two-component system, OmpR family, KDP operon response regulator KdpE
MTVHPLVLAIDDDPALLRLVRLQLADHDIRVVTAATADEALSMDERLRPDLALIDLKMPDTDGIEVMERLRDRRDIPVIMLTGCDGDSDKVRGLEHGADDYLVKPFSADELNARVRAVLRRSVGASTASGEVRTGSLLIDLARRMAELDGKPVPLTRIEWMLLESLAASPGKIVLGRELLSRVWGPEYREYFHYLRVSMSRLRKKIGDDAEKSQLIKTFPGLGYMFDPSSTS